RQRMYDDLARAEILVAERAAGVRANSRAVVETMRKLYGLHFRDDRLFLLPHGMEDRSSGRSLAHTLDDFIDVLYAGRFEGRKGTDVLLRIIASLCARHPRARFLLVGDDRALPGGTTLGGEFRDHHRKAAFLERVLFTGEVSDEKLEQYLA